MSDQMLTYQTDDGQTQVEARFDDDEIWLSQIQNRDSVIKKSLTTADDGKHYKTSLYNLDEVISVGYRVKSRRCTQFRIRATQRLREYLAQSYQTIYILAIAPLRTAQ